MDFIHDAPASRVVFGSGSRRQIPAEIDRLGAGRVLLIAGGRQRAVADELAAALGDTVVHRVHEVRQHVPEADATATAAAAAGRGADLLVSVGGGSATGLAKAVALRTGRPVLAVATTYAGSELSPLWGITAHGTKVTGRSRAVVPAVAVYDPELTLSLPPDVSAASGMNAMAHLVEALYSPAVSPVTVDLATRGIAALAAALPAVVDAPSDLAARTRALYGAWLGGWALGVATMGLHHRVCHVLGGTYDLPHAGTHSAMLPYVTAFNAPAAPAAMAQLAAALAEGAGAGEGAGGAGPAAGLHRLAARIGAPTSLADVGFDAGRIGEAARLAAAMPPVNPRAVDEPALRALLEAAYAGRCPE